MISMPICSRLMHLEISSTVTQCGYKVLEKYGQILKLITKALLKEASFNKIQ